MTESEVLALTADKIRSVTRPEFFFPADVTPTLDEFKTRLRKLLSIWHTKASSDRSFDDVFTRVKKLHEEGMQKLQLSMWSPIGEILSFESKTSLITARYYHKAEIPGWGFRLEGNSFTFIKTSKDNQEFVDAWESVSRIFSRTDSQFKKPGTVTQFEHQFRIRPVVYTSVDDKEILVRLQRPAGFINVEDVKAKLGEIPVPHVIWILGRLYNLACLMQIENFFNLNICPSSIYVEPEMHRAVLLDGWQYVKPDGIALGAPGRTVRMFPDLAKTKTPTVQMMLGMIKRTGLELLGDPFGTNLLHRGTVEPAFAQWLLTPAGTNAIDEYAAYVEMRDKAYAKKFIQWGFTFDQIYKD